MNKQQALEQSNTIWSFWEGPDCDVILRCFESMKIQNPTRMIIVLNKRTLKRFLDPEDYPFFNGKRGCPDDFDKIQYLADWVRITLLEKYGGVWLDASTIMTNSVESWISEDRAKITMFPMHANDNIHGNWAMAAPKGHALLREWRRELSAVFDETGSGEVPTAYINRVFEEHPALVELWNNPSSKAPPPPLPYLWVYLALQVVLQKHPELHQTVDLLPCIDGPMYRRYLHNIIKGENDPIRLSQQCADHLASHPLDLKKNDRFFIKLVGKDRDPVRAYVESGEYEPESALATFCELAPRPIAYGRDLHKLSARPAFRQRIRGLSSRKSMVIDEREEEEELLSNFWSLRSLPDGLYQSVVLERMTSAASVA